MRLAIEKVLQEANIRWFVVDAHGLMLAKPRPRHAIYAPCFTSAGPAAFARDPRFEPPGLERGNRLSRRPAYREFYRDIGFDLPAETVFPDSAD